MRCPACLAAIARSPSRGEAARIPLASPPTKIIEVYELSCVCVCFMLNKSKAERVPKLAPPPPTFSFFVPKLRDLGGASAPLGGAS